MGTPLATPPIVETLCQLERKPLTSQEKFLDNFTFAENKIKMDSLFSPSAASRLDSRFELRQVGGSSVVVLKGETWQATASLVHPAGELTAAHASSSTAKGASVSGTVAVPRAGSGEARHYTPSSLSTDERYELCRSVGEECIQEEELRALLKIKAHPVCYDGFEPSGRMHIAQGILKSILVNKLTSAGCIFKFYVADWFAL